jgi:hypothetical protein
MFCFPGLIFDGTEGVRSRFHILRSRTRFRRFRERQLQFSYFALPNSFLAIPWALGFFFMFCAPRLIFVGTEGVGSRFHVLPSQTRFSAVPRRRVPFSSFALPVSFSTISEASGPVFLFCARELVFGGNVGLGSCFHVLRSRTHFRQYQGRRVPFSCFALPDSFSVVHRASDPVFKFCAPRLIFDGTEGVGSRFHVLRSLTRFRRFRERWVYFSCFVFPDSFSTEPRASVPVFKFCAPELVFDNTEGVWSSFHVLRSWIRIRRFRGHRV